MLIVHILVFWRYVLPISLPLVLSYELVNLVLLKIFAILAFCVWRGK